MPETQRPSHWRPYLSGDGRSSTVAAIRILEAWEPFSGATHRNLFRRLRGAMFLFSDLPIIGLLVLYVFETPAWCLNNGKCEWSCYPTMITNFLPFKAGLAIECGLLVVLTTYAMLEVYLLGSLYFRWKKGFLRMRVRHCALVVMIMDVIAAWGKGTNSVRVDGYMRVVLYASAMPKVWDALGHLLKLISSVIDVWALLTVYLCVAAAVGIVLFENTAQGEATFSTFGAGVWNLLILLTTTNFPNIMLPSYNTSRWTVLYWVAFVTCGVFLLFPMVLAVVFNLFSAHSAAAGGGAANSSAATRSAAAAAFELLDADGDGFVDAAAVAALVSTIERLEGLPVRGRRIVGLGKRGLPATMDEAQFVELVEGLRECWEKRLANRPSELERLFPAFYHSRKFQALRHFVMDAEVQIWPCCGFGGADAQRVRLARSQSTTLRREDANQNGSSQSTQKRRENGSQNGSITVHARASGDATPAAANGEPGEEALPEEKSEETRSPSEEPEKRSADREKKPSGSSAAASAAASTARTVAEAAVSATAAAAAAAAAEAADLLTSVVADTVFSVFVTPGRGRIVYVKWYTFVELGLKVLVAAILSLSTINNYCGFRSQSLCVYDWALIALALPLSADVALKLLCYGLHAFLQRTRFRFEFTLTLAGTVASVFAIAYRNGRAAWPIRVVAVFRLIYAASALRLLPRFRTLLLTLGTVVSRATTLLNVLFVWIFFMGVLGVNLFGGLVCNPNLEETPSQCAGKVHNDEYTSNDFYALNFNDLAGSFVTLFALLVVNNWYIFAEAFADYSGTNWALAFFIANLFVGVTVVINLITSVILAAFWDSYKVEYSGGSDAGSPKAQDGVAEASSQAAGTESTDEETGAAAPPAEGAPGGRGGRLRPSSIRSRSGGGGSEKGVK